LSQQTQTAVFGDSLFQSALRAANAGERDALFEPAKTRRRGKPYQLDGRRAIVVSHVYYLLGKGLKKHVALERIAKAIAVSVETLRDWEKELGKDDWYEFDWGGAYVAGFLEQEIKEKSYWELLEKYGANYFGPQSDFDTARYFLDRIKDDWSLEKLKADLRRLHSPDNKLRGRKKALPPQ
jgi:hypothetical protein